MSRSGPAGGASARTPEARRILLEICIDAPDGALAAAAGGADRVELCQGLSEGGTTPSAGLLSAVRETVDLDVVVLIRPRAGDFCYTESELDVMRRDIDVAKELGANGVALGVLEPSGRIDARRLAPLIERARPLTVTFHRAFDVTIDPEEALGSLIDVGVDRILTSGQERDAEAGIELIARLVTLAADRIAIMPGGGVRPHNTAAILARTGAREIHSSARGTRPTAKRHANPRCRLGADGLGGGDLSSVAITDGGCVRQLRDAIGRT